MTYAIIGGGLSGALCIIELMRNAKNPLTINLFEKNSNQLFKGVAYSSSLSHQLLNVPASHMSVLHDQPDHFINWYEKRVNSIDRDSFVSRHIFGSYVAETLRATVSSFPEHKLNIVHENVVDVKRDTKGYSVITKKDISFFANSVILCTGNFPPSDVVGISEQILKYEKYVSHPWSGFKIQSIDNNDEVLLIGSGLTMVDQVLSLIKNGHQGQITVISRRGFLPLTHGQTKAIEFNALPDLNESDINNVLRWFRNELKNAAIQDTDWRSVVNALRDFTTPIWSALSTESKQRFLRHLRPFWEIHRHRIPVESSQKLVQLIQSGQLNIRPGRVRDTSIMNGKIMVGIKPKGKENLEYFQTDWIINCTGPQANYRKIKSELFENLFKSGLAEIDELNLGIKTDLNGRLLNDQNHVFENIFVVGPPAKGILWECTALREIRKQAVQLATKQNTLL